MKLNKELISTVKQLSKKAYEYQPHGPYTRRMLNEYNYQDAAVENAANTRQNHLLRYIVDPFSPGPISELQVVL